MDQGMEPEDALDKAAERHGVDPEEVEKWIAAGNAVKIKERKLTKGEEKKKEKNVKGMKKNKDDFEKRYGKESKAVMYATATKMAKESLLWSIETGQDLNESIDKIIQVLEEMDRREFMKTAGATAALSAMPGIAKAMSNDKLIVKADNGKVFDISKFPGTLQEKIDSFKDSIKKVYAKSNTAVPSFKFYLNDKFIGSIDHTGNVYKENFADDDAVATARELKKELYAVQKAIDDIYDDPNWKTRRDELKKLIRRESELEKEMGLVRPGNMWRYDHDSLGNKIKENFADGKKKGNGKPGRVKKSGASCSSSVTELRKKAKNASGERAKMYHWCANMKSGKKK
jgi:hypothetical protein